MMSTRGCPKLRRVDPVRLGLFQSSLSTLLGMCVRSVKEFDIFFRGQSPSHLNGRSVLEEVCLMNAHVAGFG